MSDWREVALGDIGCIVTGTTPPAKNRSWFGDRFEFITPSDIDASSRRATPTRWLSDEGAAKLASRLLPADSVCFVCIGATIGKLCMTRTPSFTNQQINTVVVNREHDPRFLYYLLRSEAERIAAAASGAATPIINKSSFAATKVRIPPARTQSLVGAILGTIDDLIENNRRRIALLERMAQAIYREWFVRFRYPGHEEDKLVDSPVGPIPAGWEVGLIEDVCSYLNRGIAPKYAEDGGSFVVNQRCIRDGRLDMARARRQERSVPSEKQLRFGDILINSTGEGTLGRVAQVYSDMSDATVDTHVTIARRAEGVNIDWFGLTVIAKKADFEALAVGSTGQTELGRSAIGSTPVLVAPSELQSSFGEVVAPLRLHARSLTASEKSLVATRDRVLPRLVTGAIDVSHLDLDALLDETAA